MGAGPRTVLPLQTSVRVIASSASLSRGPGLRCPAVAEADAGDTSREGSVSSVAGLCEVSERRPAGQASAAGMPCALTAPRPPRGMDAIRGGAEQRRPRPEGDGGRGSSPSRGRGSSRDGSRRTRGRGNGLGSGALVRQKGCEAAPRHPRPVCAGRPSRLTGNGLPEGAGGGRRRPRKANRLGRKDPSCPAIRPGAAAGPSDARGTAVRFSRSFPGGSEAVEWNGEWNELYGSSSTRGQQLAAPLAGRVHRSDRASIDGSESNARATPTGRAGHTTRWQRSAAPTLRVVIRQAPRRRT